MEGHTATGKRAYRGHTATGKQNNLAGVHWCPERQALIMFIMIWNQRLVAKKTGHEAHEQAGRPHGHCQAGISPAGQCWQMALRSTDFGSWKHRRADNDNRALYSKEPEILYSTEHSDLEKLACKGCNWPFVQLCWSALVPWMATRPLASGNIAATWPLASRTTLLECSGALNGWHSSFSS